MTIEEAATSLILADPARLLEDPSGPIEVRGVTVHPVVARRGDREHRPISVECIASGRTRTIELWLKSRPGLAALFPILEECDRRLADRIFARPLYRWRSDDGGASFIITERVAGEPLRDRMLKAAAVGRASRLGPIFRSNGAKLRALHDAFAPPGNVSVSDLIGDSRSLIVASRFLTVAQRAAFGVQLERHSGALAMIDQLPRRRIHHDWILRNILVDGRGRDIVIDCDSMRTPEDLRWYDVAYFMVNLESQIRWAPLVTRRTLSPLWREFWSGYRSGSSTIDGLTLDRIEPMLWLLRVRYLLGGTMREPLHRMFAGRLGRRYLRALVSSLERGEPSLLGRAIQPEDGVDAANEAASHVVDREPGDRGPGGRP